MHPSDRKRLETTGFDEDHDQEAVFSRECGDLRLEVRRFGIVWGFLAWHTGTCLRGEKDWDWTAFDACEAANRYAAEYTTGQSRPMITEEI